MRSRYHQQTANHLPLNGRRPEVNIDAPLKSVDWVSPPRNGYSFLRWVFVPVCISLTLLSLAAYAVVNDDVKAVGIGAGLSFFFAIWRIQVWDNLPTDAIDRREYLDLPTETITETLLRPSVNTGRPGSKQELIGRFAYTHEKWVRWAQVLSDNDWKITRDILKDVRVHDKCIFTNLTNSYNDLVGEMHRLGWTTNDKSRLSEAGIAHFQGLLDPPTPTQ